MSSLLSLHDLVGDLVIYRNLDPIDSRLPRFGEAWKAMGLATGVRPRKQDPEFASALIWLLRRARQLDLPRGQISEVLLFGDTALSDGSAFRSVRARGGWRGWAFIGSEKGEEPTVTVSDGVYVSNRWSDLADFLEWVIREGARLDEQTAVLVDIDKTALAARGRNDKAIDSARLAAIEGTLREVSGVEFDQEEFRLAYATLNVPAFHSFTADNQDYLAYICLMINAGFIGLEALQAEVRKGRLNSFFDLIEEIDANLDRLPSASVRALHAEVIRLVRAGDPTPFKAFRRRELVETVARMGHLGDSVPMAERLVNEICLTQEVVDAVRWLRRRGCLLVAASDKPDEATTPTAELASRGVLPLHLARTHLLGPSIATSLP